MTPDVLYHYTCHHGHRALRTQRCVVPAAQHSPRITVALPPDLAVIANLAWFTDLAAPDRWALGLTSKGIVCDRTQHRWRVLDTDRPPIGWGRVRASLLTPATLDVLEAVEAGAQPARWFIASWPVPVAYDPIN